MEEQAAYFRPEAPWNSADEVQEREKALKAEFERLRAQAEEDDLRESLQRESEDTGDADVAHFVNLVRSALGSGEWTECI